MNKVRNTRNSGKRENILKIEKFEGKKIGMYIKLLWMDENMHPTRILKHIIKEIYGHRVKLDNLIDLIESGKL